MIRNLFRGARHDEDDDEDRRAREAERRAREVKVRADKVALRLEKRLRENHFAEGLSAAWGATRHGRT